MAFDTAAAAPPTATDDDVLLLDRREGARGREFLGVTFALMDPPTLLRRVAQASRRTDRFRFVVTPNVDHLVRLAREPDLQPLYDGAWINVCDSRILELLAGWSGIDLPVMPGSDLTRQLIAAEIHPDEPVVVIGADAEAVEALKTRHGLGDIRWHAPPMGLRHRPDAIEAAAAFMAAHPARFHFICVGSPQQELVAAAALARGDVTGVGLCVGASLDFLSGRIRRAPAWMQAARLEWLQRLASEPWRMWRRYLVEGPQIFRIWRRWSAAQSRNA